MPSVDHIYIIHALNGYESHEKRLKEILPKTKIPFTFITDGDPSVWKEEDIQNNFHPQIKNKLKTGILSCTLNHMFAYKTMLEKNQEYVVVFENDPFFLDGVEGFRPKVETLLKEADSLDGAIVISLENTTLRFPSKKVRMKGKFLYAADKGRAAGAYIINKKAAFNMINDLEINKCNDVIDWWHNDMIDRGVIQMYWAHPALTEQGSHNGKLHAGISSKKANFFRQIRWQIQKAYKVFLSNFR